MSWWFSVFFIWKAHEIAFQETYIIDISFPCRSFSSFYCPSAGMSILEMPGTFTIESAFRNGRPANLGKSCNCMSRCCIAWVSLPKYESPVESGSREKAESGKSWFTDRSGAVSTTKEKSSQIGSGLSCPTFGHHSHFRDSYSDLRIEISSSSLHQIRQVAARVYYESDTFPYRHLCLDEGQFHLHSVCLSHFFRSRAYTRMA